MAGNYVAVSALNLDFFFLFSLIGSVFRRCDGFVFCRGGIRWEQKRSVLQGRGNGKILMPEDKIYVFSVRFFFKNLKANYKFKEI